jgi:hypothetical protein
MKSFKVNLKGISPIFAILILIAISIIAGIVVYMFTSSFASTLTGGGTVGQERIVIQAVSCVKQTGAIKIYAQNISGGTIIVDSIILKDTAGNVVGVPIPITSTMYNPPGGIGSSLSTISFNADAARLTQGASYTVTLITKAGGSFPSSSFIAT